MAPEVLRDEPYNEKVGTWYKWTSVVRCFSSVAVYKIKSFHTTKITVILICDISVLRPFRLRESIVE